MQDKIQKNVKTTYLLLVSAYILIAVTQLTNIIIALTVGNSAGTFFEFINASTDRTVTYMLSIAITFYIIAKLRKTTPTILVCTFFLISYFTYAPLVDLFWIVFSLVVLTWFLTLPQPFSDTNRKKAVSQVAVYLILFLAAIEVLALICWFSFPFDPKLSQDGICKYFVELETKTFILTGSLAPILAVLVLFSWITKPVIPRINLLNRLLSIVTQNGNIEKTVHPHKKYLTLTIVACALIVSFLVVLYPFSPELNANMNPVGVDFESYQDWLTKTVGNNFFQAATTFFFERTDRPLSLIFIYIIKSVTGLLASTVVQYFPLILAPALVLSVYFFVHETKNANTSLFAAFLAASSFHIIVELYGFFLSNWMAVIELYLFMGVYFGALNKKSVPHMAAACLFSVMILFTHSWTWGMVVGVLFLYMLLTAMKHRKNLTTNKFELLSITALILVNLSVCFARNAVLGVPLTNFEAVTIAQKTVSVPAVASFGNDLFYTFFNTHYGFFVNPMILALSAIGAVITVLGDKSENRYLTAWLMGSSIFLFLAAGWTIKSRILLSLPFPFFAAIGLVALTKLVDRLFDQNKTALIKNMTITYVILMGLNYAFRCAFEMSQLV